MKDFLLFRLLGIILMPLLLVLGTAQALPSLDPFGTGVINTGLGAISSDVENLVDTSGTFQKGSPPILGNVPTAWTPVDPNLVFLSTTTSAITEFFLVGESAGLDSWVGIGLSGDYDLQNGDKQLLFDDGDFGNQSFNDPTDFTKQNLVPPGKVDFFLLTNANGAPNGAGGLHNLFWTNPLAATPVAGTNVNPDGLQHALAFLHSSGNHILYAWEDLLLTGPDSDFNDTFVLFSSESIVIAPEPTTYLMLGSFLILAMVLKRRKAAKQAS